MLPFIYSPSTFPSLSLLPLNLIGVSPLLLEVSSLPGEFSPNFAYIYIYIQVRAWCTPPEGPHCWVNSESCPAAGNNGDTCSKCSVLWVPGSCLLWSACLTPRKLTAPYLLNGSTTVQNVLYTRQVLHTQVRLLSFIFSPQHPASVPRGPLVNKKVPASSDSL